MQQDNPCRFCDPVTGFVNLAFERREDGRFVTLCPYCNKEVELDIKRNPKKRVE